jgi:signal transduction histidine kinase
MQEPGKDTTSRPTFESERLKWRLQLLQGIAWALTLPLILGGFVVWREEGYPELSRYLDVAAAAGMIYIAARRPFSAAVRAGLILAIIQTLATVAMLQVGYPPNALVGLATGCVIATLLLGRRWGLGLLALSLVTIFAVGAVHRWDSALRIASWAPFLDAARVRVTVRTAVFFLVCAGTLVIGTSYLLERSDRTAQENQRALELLGRQQGELKAQEAALRKARELELLGRLSGSVAHDVNNALLVIQANADWSASRPGADTQALDAIRTAVAQAAATTRQLRTFGPQMPLPPAPLSLAEAVTRAGRFLLRVVPANIELNVTTLPVPDIFADEAQVHGAVTNLVLNACDAMPEGGELRVGVRPAEAGETAAAHLAGGKRYVALEVEDTGTGMSPETMRRIFEPYFTTKGAMGTGLGLASVQEVLQKQGGGITVESQQGRGTKFTTFWPAADAEQLTSRQPPARSPGAPKATVLIVDDDAAVCRALANALSARGFTALEAGNGRDALLFARRYGRPIDVMCTDSVMPGPSLRTFLEGFRQAHPEARVIVCSGYPGRAGATPEDLVDAVLPKPFAADALAELVQKLIT